MKTILEAPDYSIDKSGNVYNKHGKILKPRRVGYKGALNNSMYLQYALYVNGKRITRYQHRLLAQAYIPNPLGLPDVDHKDGDKENNSLDNLEWVSKSDNIKRAYDAGFILLPYEHRQGYTERLDEGVTTIPKGSRAKLPEAVEVS